MESHLSPIISPREALVKLREPYVVIVDARGGPDAQSRFLEGHLDNAFIVSLETDLSAIGPDAARGGRHPLPHPREFSALLGKMGISPSTHVLVYDDKAGANAAARFWWMIRSAGHHAVQVIDGGLTALQEAGAHLSKNPAPPWRNDPPYPFTAWQLPTADIDLVDRLRREGDAVVIDVRESYRYRGESEPIDLVAGHVPGAINIPYLANLQPSGRFRSPEELTSLYSPLFENTDSNRVVVHCGSGVTACHSLLAMDAAGLPIPQLYVGSWSEWSRNDKPVGIGENP